MGIGSVFPEINTLLAALAIALLVSLLSCLTLWWQHRSMKGPIHWVIALALISLGIILLVLRGTIPDFVSIVFANGFVLLGYCFFYTGFAGFFGKPPRLRLLFVIMAICWGPFFYLYQFPEFYFIRFIFTHIGIMAICLVASFTIFLQVRGKLIAHLNGFFFVVHGIMHGIFPVLAAYFVDNPGDNIATHQFIAGTYLWSIFATLVITTGIVHMVAERLGDRLQTNLTALEAAQKRDEAHIREQRNFYAMLSHELRTPLSTISTANKIIGLNQFETDNEIAEEIAQETSRIGRSMDQINQMIDNLIVDNFMAETSAVSLEVIELGNLLEDICRQHNTPLRTDSETPVFIKGALHLLPLLFNNLIDNAKKYTHSQEAVEVHLSKVEDGYIQVKITDDGPELPPDEQSKIFDKYYRMESNRHIQGSGLGLHLVKLVCDAHNAEISIDQQPPGKAFCVTFKEEL